MWVKFVGEVSHRSLGEACMHTIHDSCMNSMWVGVKCGYTLYGCNMHVIFMS